MSRFVVLEHIWNGTHWDLMLERGGALRTWALAVWPPPGGEGAAVPARALPDHRLAYLDYEGPVSRGRGTVRRVEEGRFEVLVESDDRLAARFEGRALQGVWELVKVEAPGREGSSSWIARPVPE